MSGAKCTVSDYSRGAVERILTVSGPVDAVAKVSQSNISAESI
jgi:heterogeneous nuclear rnp K-like protein